MQDINLITQPNKTSQEVTKKTNAVGSFLKLMVILLVISLLTVASAYGIIYYRLRQTRDEHTKLKKELSTLEKSEQRYIFLRDRLDKISTIQKAFNTQDEISISRDLLANVEAPSRISGLVITPEMVETEITTDSSLNITKLFSYLVGKGDYIRINMVSFDYNPKTAYKVDLQIFK